MKYAEQLLEQARHLAERDKVGRPNQGNLGRSVSTAYYALFHFLTDQACRSMMGAGEDPKLRALRGILARAFDHGGMRKVSKSFASGMLPKKLNPPLLNLGVLPKDISAVADAFQTLQDSRHAADYDPLWRWERDEVITLVDSAAEAMRLWPGVRNTPAGRLYLMALLVRDRVRE